MERAEARAAVGSCGGSMSIHVCRLCGAELTRAFVDLGMSPLRPPEATGCAAGTKTNVPARSARTRQRLDERNGKSSSQEFQTQSPLVSEIVGRLRSSRPGVCACTKPLPPTAADSFNPDNGSLGPNWTDISDGGLAIVSLAAAGTASAGVSGDTWNAGTFTSNQYSQVAVTSTQLTGSQWIGADGSGPSSEGGPHDSDFR
jgi:hypothetical protein